MLNRPSFEQIFHNAPQKIGMVEIYYSPVSLRSVQELENIIKTISKEMRINMAKPLSDEMVKVYIYPNSKIFYSFFGSSIESNTNIFKRKSVEIMNFIETEDGAIHMFFSGGAYKDIMKVLVSKVFEDYIEEKKESKLKDLVKKELEDGEEQQEEELEELEEEIDEELEEEIDEEEPEEEIEDVDKEIEEIKKEKKVNVPEWLELGWIMYKVGKLRNAKNIQDYSNHIKEKGVASSGKIQKKQEVFSEYNYADESAYALVEYIIENYGFKKLVALFENPNIQETLGLSKEKFKRESKISIKNKYIGNKVEEITKKNTKFKNEVQEKKARENDGDKIKTINK